MVPGVCAQVSAFELPDSHLLSTGQSLALSDSLTIAHQQPSTIHMPEHREKGGVVPGVCAQVSAFESLDSHCSQ